jgi:hypothetical protein
MKPKTVAYRFYCTNGQLILLYICVVKVSSENPFIWEIIHSSSNLFENNEKQSLTGTF